MIAFPNACRLKTANRKLSLGPQHFQCGAHSFLLSVEHRFPAKLLDLGIDKKDVVALGRLLAGSNFGDMKPAAIDQNLAVAVVDLHATVLKTDNSRLALLSPLAHFLCVRA